MPESTASKIAALTKEAERNPELAAFLSGLAAARDLEPKN